MHVFKKTGFTLIELLVVIAIIALLMAITVAAVRKAKEKAQVVICSSNMRQVVYGLVAYTNDHEGHLPPSVSHVNGGGYHRPTELNWDISTNSPVGGIVTPNKYIYRYLGSYLPEVSVYNCTMAPIRKDSAWPPETSGKAALGTYEEFYRDGTYAPLHATYTFLWNYQGYNHDVSIAVDKTNKHFEGPSRMSSSNKLVIQDTFKYLTGNSNILWETPGYSWYSSHRFKDFERAKPYYVRQDTSESERPSCKLNAGYLDGHVDRFNSEDAVRVKNYGAVNFLSPKFR